MIGWDPDTAIPLRLLPDDELVFVLRELDYLAGPKLTTAVGVISHLATRRAKIVIVADIVEVGGVLARDDTWVYTRFRGTVHSVLKASAPGITSGQSIDAYLSEGEVVIGKVRVRSGESSTIRRTIPHISPQRYLFFLTDALNLQFVVHTPLLVDEEGRLTYAWHHEVHNQPINPLAGLNVQDVARVTSELKQ